MATGLLQPGERVPTVRHLADSLEIAPGTVARAYRELERRGAVVTDGARGTTVARRPAPPAPEAARKLSLVALLRPVAVEAFHQGFTAAGGDGAGHSWGEVRGGRVTVATFQKGQVG